MCRVLIAAGPCMQVAAVVAQIVWFYDCSVHACWTLNLIYHRLFYYSAAYSSGSSDSQGCS